MPEPHIDDAIASVVVMPLAPLRIGQRTSLDFESHFPAVGEDDADIGAAFPIGQPHLGIGFDHTRLTASPLGQHRLAGQMPQRLGMMPPADGCEPRWMGEVRPAHSGADYHGYFVAAFGETGRAHQRPVTGEAFAPEVVYLRVGGICRRADVLPAREIERDVELVGETHSDTPVE